MRARNIKPGFFKNEDLADLDPHARLLFIGLWCMADREGRLEDRPKRIRADVFPYEMVDVDEMLNDLVETGLIIRYEVNGQRCIQILNFTKHQSPHNNEKDSEIPPHTEESGSTSNQGEKDLQPTTPALRPDSLIPDSLNDDSQNGGKPPDYVAHSVDHARTLGITLDGQTKARIGKAAKEQAKSGADPSDILAAVERLVAENKPASTLGYLVRDVQQDRSHNNAPEIELPDWAKEVL